MAWEDVTYACGHEGRVQMYGKHSERDRKVAWMSKHKDCPACEQAAREAANAAAAQANADHGMPALTGTPKQVAWAESIRAGLIVGVSGLPMEAKLVALIKTVTDATWWIEHRISGGATLDLGEVRVLSTRLCQAAGYVDDAGRLTEAGRLWYEG